MVEFDAIVSMLDSSVYGYHIPVPSEISAQFKETDRRVRCVFNGNVSVQCALMPSGKGTYMITLQKELRKKLKVDLGDRVHVALEKDNSEYGMPLPEELIELWTIDPDADRIFHSLSKGKQRTLIYLIGKGKRTETRAKKAVAILEYLKMVRGNLDFREMNEFIKNYNAL